MTLLVPWLVFPAVCVALSWGCGLLVERVAGTTVPTPLHVPLGIAVVSVVAGFATMFDATAELAATAAVALAVLGVGLRRRERRPVDGWAVACAAATFLVFGAPVLASGEATFSGYVRLDDTATFLAIVDRTLEHGRSLDGLPPSTYEATLAVNLANGYPTGSLLPLGIASRLVGSDPAWTFQPYVSLLAALLALCLYQLAAVAGLSRPFRFVAGALAAQAALLYGFAQWGGVKELFAAFLVALTAATIAVVRHGGGRSALVPSVAAAALLGGLSVAAGVWLLPACLAAAYAAVRRSWRSRVAVGVAATACLSLPALGGAWTFLRSANRATFEDPGELGNLTRRLPFHQVLGVWPSGDFRTEPPDARAAAILLLVALVAACVGVAIVVVRRLAAPALYVAATLGAAAIVGWTGSPWLAAKTLAVAAPAVLFVGVVGAAALAGDRRRVESAVLLSGIACGVLWSNTLALRDASLAPRARLAELERIGERFAGQGPALMTEYQPYGVRHFLRRLDPEGASELRRRPIPLRDGRILAKAEYADVTSFAADTLRVYRTLVLHRSPSVGRPPSDFRLRWRGRYYEVWQQPAYVSEQTA